MTWVIVSIIGQTAFILWVTYSVTVLLRKSEEQEEDIRRLADMCGFLSGDYGDIKSGDRIRFRIPKSTWSIDLVGIFSSYNRWDQTVWIHEDCGKIAGTGERSYKHKKYSIHELLKIELLEVEDSDEIK